MDTGAARSTRADAVRNRSLVLEVAYQAFAADGAEVAIDEIARRAGVGIGTVYRHFPTKKDLYQAVVQRRLQQVVDHGRALLSSETPREAFAIFFRSMVVWGAADQGLVDALASAQFTLDAAAPGAEQAYLDLLGDLLEAAQRAGSVRSDVGVSEVKALIVGCQAMHHYSGERSKMLTSIVLDGLRDGF